MITTKGFEKPPGLRRLQLPQLSEDVDVRGVRAGLPDRAGRRRDVRCPRPGRHGVPAYRSQCMDRRRDRGMARSRNINGMSSTKEKYLMTTMDNYTRANAATSALVFIDVQKDFYEDGAPAHIAGTSEAIPAMAKLAALFREHNLPIIHVVRLYKPDGANVDLVRRHAVE